MRQVFLGLLVLASLAGTAHAKEGWKDFVGKRLPGFHVLRWLNTEGAAPQPKDLEGSVWMLQFLSVG